MQEEYNRLKLLLDRSEDRSNALSSELEKAQECRKAAEGQGRQLQEQVNSLQQENVDLKNKIILESQKIQSLDEEIQKLQHTYIDLQNENDLLKHESQSGLDEYNSIQKRLE
eukprot:c33434_g1_i1 orf=3-338(+)